MYEKIIIAMFFLGMFVLIFKAFKSKKLKIEIEEKESKVDVKVFKIYLADVLPEGFRDMGQWDLPGYANKWVCVEIDLIIFHIKVGKKIV